MSNRHGETGWNEYVNVDLLKRLVALNARNSEPATSDAEMIADPRTESMDLAIRLFDTALQMNPNSPDAYRDRAEAWRLEAHLCTRAHESQTAKSHLAAALESATAACALGNYRQPGSLRTLAEITHDLNLDESAADYAEKAYACCSLEDRPATENLLKRYYALVAPAAAGTASQIAMTRGSGDGTGNADSAAASDVASPAAGRPELPPGFMFRSP